MRQHSKVCSTNLSLFFFSPPFSLFVGMVVVERGSSIAQAELCFLRILLPQRWECGCVLSLVLPVLVTVTSVNRSVQCSFCIIGLGDGSWFHGDICILYMGECLDLKALKWKTQQIYYEIADAFITLSKWIDFHLDSTPLIYTYSSSAD